MHHRKRICKSATWRQDRFACCTASRARHVGYRSDDACFPRRCSSRRWVGEAARRQGAKEARQSESVFGDARACKEPRLVERRGGSAIAQTRMKRRCSALVIVDLRDGCDCATIPPASLDALPQWTVVGLVRMRCSLALPACHCRAIVRASAPMRSEVRG